MKEDEGGNEARKVKEETKEETKDRDVPVGTCQNKLCSQ
jgi:hypothetical protein